MNLNFSVFSESVIASNQLVISKNAGEKLNFYNKSNSNTSIFSAKNLSIESKFKWRLFNTILDKVEFQWKKVFKKELFRLL